MDGCIAGSEVVRCSSKIKEEIRMDIGLIYHGRFKVRRVCKKLNCLYY